MSGKKVTYLKKTVSFQGRQLVMFSIDGATWSSRKEELLAIIERHELERQNFGGQIKGGPQAKMKSTDDAKSQADKVDDKTKSAAVKTKAAKGKKAKAPAKAVKGKTKVLAEIKPGRRKNSKGKLPEPKKRVAAAPKARKSSKSRRKVA